MASFYDKSLFTKSIDEVKLWLKAKLKETGNSGSQTHLYDCWMDRILFEAPTTEKNKGDHITKEGYIFTPPSSGHPFFPLIPAASPPTLPTTHVNTPAPPHSSEDPAQSIFPTTSLDTVAPSLSSQDLAELQAKEHAVDLHEMRMAFDLQRGEGATGGAKKNKTVGGLLEDEVKVFNADFAVTHFLSSLLAFTAHLFAPASIDDVLIWLAIILQWCTLAPQKRMAKDAFPNVISVSLVKERGNDAVVNLWADLRKTGSSLLPCGASNPPRKGGKPPSLQSQAKAITQWEYCKRLAELITPKRVTWIMRTVTALVWYGACGETFQGLTVRSGNCIPPGNCGEACFWLCLARSLLDIASNILKKPDSWSKLEIHLVTLNMLYTRPKLAEVLSDKKTIKDLVSELKESPCAMSCCVCCRLVLTMIKDAFADVMEGIKILHKDPVENAWVEVPTFDVQALNTWIAEMEQKHKAIPTDWRDRLDATEEQRKAEEELREAAASGVVTTSNDN
ncbi:hypothetical protein CALCODRAFT_510488 [Calocera cornea HHB12733]|uniref:Uncharacterized protein n=1 Tax=Calocera cornea HHB12733 TaxID=1353952 RepID=A0A165EGF1_9BASI|nr:hypothetical protein CALCODRAFT_510488 [Calocera cornea HHB12733]